MSNAPPLCWVLSDGRRGIENQALGLAEAAAHLRALNIQTKTLSHGPAFRAMTPSLQFTMKSHPKDYGLPSGLPNIAIGCGRQAIAPLLALKKHKPEIFTAYVQAPKIDCAKFDLVIAPAHDGLCGENVETMIGSPSRVTDELIIGQTLQFSEHLMGLPMPRAALLIGGPSKKHKLTKTDHALHLAAAKAAHAAGYSVLITPSRRTPLWAIEDYRLFASDMDNVWLYDGDGENPYYAFLGGADVLLITEDSTNMLTEACATGKTVFRLPMTGATGKFQNLYDALETRCNLIRFNGDFSAPAYEPLRETARMAEQLWAHIDARSAVYN